MKNNLHNYLVLITVICSIQFAFSQQITVDSNISIDDLVRNNLETDCVLISNVTSSVNGTSNGIVSYGQFNQSTSNFPLQNGIMLSTGNAESGGNNNSSQLSDGSNSWTTDPDIETYIPGLTNTFNATSIEFDIVAATNLLQFNYLIASEEYTDANACSSSDSFALLIKEGDASSTNPYTNIALLPNSTTPISVSNIRREISASCPAQNQQYFDGLNFGDTNYTGRTTVLSTAATVNLNTVYHIKLIIADQRDYRLDSAVFIEANSLNTLDLEDSHSTCASFYDIDATINNPQATYQWYRDGTILPTETNATIRATSADNISHTYRVVVTAPLGSTTCSEEDEIIVTLNTDEAFPYVIEYELCEDTANGSGETFDLTTKTAEIQANSPFTNTHVSYYSTLLDARNQSNSITTAHNLTTPTVYVRVDDQDSNCNAFPSFDLIVNPLPTITAPARWPICDEDGDPNGTTVIDLSLSDSEILNGQTTGVTVIYYRNSDGTDPIVDKTTYINQTDIGDTVYARVFDTSTGCASENIVPLVMDITRAPIVNALPEDRQFLDACEAEGTNSARFDLTEVINNIVGTLTNYTPYFYEDENDALQGNNNFIVDPTDFSDINRDSEGLGEQTLFLRVEDNTTGCASVVPFEIHSNLLSTGTQLGTFALCDDDTIATNDLYFDLETVQSFISNDLPNPVTVTFFEDDNRTIEIPKSTPFPISILQTLYIRLNDGNCEEENEIDLRVNPILTFDRVEPISYCDTDSDGFMEIDLHLNDDLITQGRTNFTVTYFDTFGDAENNVEANRLTTFINTTEETEVFARIESSSVGITCHSVSPFKVKVFAAPDSTQPNNICAVSESIENLDLIINQIVTNPAGLDIEFFRTLEAANKGDITSADWISYAERSNYNVGEETHEIFVQIKNSNIGEDCNPYSIQSFFVNIQPVIAPNSIIRVCKDISSLDPLINLRDYDEYLLNGQQSNEVVYYDITTGTEIDKDADIQSFEGNIRVRIQNITNIDCFTEAILPVSIASNPTYSPVTTLVECITPGDLGPYTYNLENKRSEIAQSSSETLIITFHSLSDNAYGNVLDIPNQNEYISPNLSETFFIRIESESSNCFEVEQIDFLGLIQPNIINVVPYETCDDGSDGDFYNGSTSFDLTSIYNNDNDDTSNLFIIEGDRVDVSTLEINYFFNDNDINPTNGFDNTNAIQEPQLSNFISETRTIHIKIFNTITECFSVFPYDLVVNSPPVFNNILPVEECYNDSNIYDMSQINESLVQDTSTTNISYYSIDNSNAIINYTDNIFNYATPGDYTIWATIEDSTTLCAVTTSFTLSINPNPIINRPADIYYCDSNTDLNDSEIFNLLDNEASIRGASQPSNLFTLNFFNTIDDAENNTNSIESTYTAFDGETIYARLDNINSGCYDITEFNLFINTKPILNLRDNEPLCDNDPRLISVDTGVTGDLYSWSSGEQTSDKLFTVSDLNQTFTVTITRPNSNGADCQSDHTFTLIPSQTALIDDFTPIVHFADPNSIIAEIDESRIGDYVFILDDGEPQDSNIFNDVSYGEHLITVRDRNGCMDISKSVFVFDIPKYVTPNNDSYSDTWHIIGKEQLPGTIVYIYNRHGKLIKTLSHTSPGWDGRYNGQNMPSDDYWFSADIVENGDSYNIRGHFALKR